MEHWPGVVDKWRQEGMIEVYADDYAVARAASIFPGLVGRCAGNPFANPIVAGVKTTHFGEGKFVVWRIVKWFAGVASGAYHHV